MMKTEVTVNATGGKILPDDKIVGSIELRNVDFHYPSKPSVKVSKNVSIKIERN